MYGLFVYLVFALAGLQQIAATHHQSQLQDDTQKALQSLETLPSHCTKDVNSLILTEQRKLPGQILYCSVVSIGIDVAEIAVDTFFNGFEMYIAVPAFFKDLKNLGNCLNESGVEAMIACAVEYLPPAVTAARVVVAALENYVGEMQMIVPVIVEEVKECFGKSVNQYNVFLDSIVEKATQCS